MDSVSSARLQLLYPPLAEIGTRLIQRLESEGIETRLVQGLRSWSEQDVLFAQGRTAPGAIVTDVAGGGSYHNFGLAFDLVPSTYAPGQPYNPDWNKSHPIWQRMEQLGVSLGLVSGANWQRLADAPHFQFTGRFPEAGPDDELRQIFKDGGTSAVWNEVTQSNQ